MNRAKTQRLGINIEIHLFQDLARGFQHLIKSLTSPSSTQLHVLAISAVIVTMLGLFAVITFFLVASKSHAIIINSNHSHPPVGTSQFVDNAFATIGFEPPDFPDWAGKSSQAFERHLTKSIGNKSAPNLFSRNLVDTIQKKIGKGLVLRVAGTSG
jgi:hypothetical protein